MKKGGKKKKAWDVRYKGKVRFLNTKSLNTSFQKSILTFLILRGWL